MEGMCCSLPWALGLVLLCTAFLSPRNVLRTTTRKEGGWGVLLEGGCPCSTVSLQHCVLSGPVSLQDPSMCQCQCHRSAF